MSSVILVSQLNVSVNPVECLRPLILTIFIMNRHDNVLMSHFFMLRLTSGKEIKVQNIVNVFNKT